MKRRGRKRKLGKRNARGLLIHERESPAARAREMPHRRGLEHPEDQLAESELGRMQLRGDLEASQVLSGQEYARAWRGYISMLGGPKRLINGRWSGFDCGGCLGLTKTEMCECHKRERKWLDAQHALRAAGWRALIAVQQVALHDQQCPDERRSALELGLDALARYFGLTKTANRSRNNKSSQHLAHPPAQR